jgi:protein gp37
VLAKGTNIQWCDDTCNGIGGCDGCELWSPPAGIFICYAGNDHARFAGQPGWAPSFDRPTVFAHRIAEYARRKDLRGRDRPKKPWLDGYPRVIFLNDESDSFTESVPITWMDDYLQAMAGCPHVWIVLTKRPSRMLEWVAHVEGRLGHVPTNFWLCSSLVAPAAVRGRVRGMLQIRERLPGHVCGLSIEPPFEDLCPLLRREFPGLPEAMTWVKLGGGSDHGKNKAAPTPVEWLRGLRDFFRRGPTAVFVKQLGSHPTEAGAPLRLKDRHGGDWREWPEDLRVREMPLPPKRPPGAPRGR